MRKMKKGQFAALLTALLLACPLTACGGDQGGAANTADTNSSVSDPSENESTDTEPEETDAGSSGTDSSSSKSGSKSK